jgi:hypothetical protein
MFLVQLFDQGIWIDQELVHEEDLNALEDNYAKQGYQLLCERVRPLQASSVTCDSSGSNLRTTNQ